MCTELLRRRWANGLGRVPCCSAASFSGYAGCGDLVRGLAPMYLQSPGSGNSFAAEMAFKRL